MKTPWHVWGVGITAVLFNAGGAFDYVMTQTGNAAYMAAFTPEQIAWFDAFPVWIDAAWAIAVWSALLGGVLILLRRKAAMPVFALSLVAMGVTFVHNFAIAEPTMAEVTGPQAFWMTFLIVAVTLALFHYSRIMTLRGVLR